MQRSLFFLFILSLLITGCYQNHKDIVKKPANLIPKEKMADILTDMEIIEGAAVYSRTHYPGYPNLEKAYYEELFKHYHVTKKQVEASLNYYNSRGDVMSGIYDKVMANLAEKEALLQIQKENEEALKHPEKVNSRHFPYLFREDDLYRRCYNPLP